MRVLGLPAGASSSSVVVVCAGVVDKLISDEAGQKPTAIWLCIAVLLSNW